MPTKSVGQPSPNLRIRLKKYMILTLRVNNKAKTISAHFHSTIHCRTQLSDRCTCFEDYDGRFHVPPHEIRNSDVQRFRFVLKNDGHISKARSAIQKAQRDSSAACGSYKFYTLTKELFDLLARWCDGRITRHPKHYFNGGNTDMLPYRKPTLLPSAYRDHVLDKVRESLTDAQVKTNELGYIYILRSHDPTSQSELKIGFSRYHPQHRSQELAKCLTRPEVVAHTQLLPFARRVEALVHAELDAARKVQWCSWCHRNHQEWFTVALDHARRSIARWSKFILLRPYISGKLRGDVLIIFANLEAIDQPTEAKTSEMYWDKAIDSVPVDESTYSRAQQIGAYLNALWMYRNIQDWTTGDFWGQNVPAPQSFDTFYEGYLCSDEANKIRKSLSNLDFETLRSIYFDENNPSGMPTSSALRTILFGKAAASAARHIDLGFNYLPSLAAKRRRLAPDVFDVVDHLNATTTGARSVINPHPGTADSPLGNATMIPVLDLKHLTQVSGPVRTWIGYDKTNIGFQGMQEAYKLGEWRGIPRFRKRLDLCMGDLLMCWRWRWLRRRLGLGLAK